MNIPAIKTVESVTIPKSFDFAKNKLGLTSLDDKEDKNLSSLALGGLYEGVSVRNLTAAYGAFANKGIYTSPYTYTKVVDSKGKVLIEKEISSNRVFSEQTAYIMTSVLETTANGSLGSPAKIPNMTAAGKTGTTNEDKDRWYVGYTPYYMGGVWYGYDSPKTVPYSRTSVVAHKLWKAVMTKLHKNLADKKFEEPSGIVRANICTQTGKLALAYTCPTTNEIFKKGNVPHEYCSGKGHKVQNEEENSETHNEAEEPNTAPTAAVSPSAKPTPSAIPDNEAAETPKPQSTPLASSELPDTEE